jgi:hypothetical protein
MDQGQYQVLPLSLTSYRAYFSRTATPRAARACAVLLLFCAALLPVLRPPVGCPLAHEGFVLQRREMSLSESE